MRALWGGRPRPQPAPRPAFRDWQALGCSNQQRVQGDPRRPGGLPHSGCGIRDVCNTKWRWVSKRWQAGHQPAPQAGTFRRCTLLASLAAIVFAAVFLMADQPSRVEVQFTDVTAQAGIHFTHNAGRTGRKYLPETLGAGCAFFDADGDGWPDILLINGKDLAPRGHRSVAALYHNNQIGRASCR